MNLSQLDTKAAANEGAKLELRDVNGVPVLKGDGNPVTITLLGKDSDTFIKAENAATNRRLAQGARLKLTAESLKAEAISTLARCTVGWDGVGIEEDETPFSYENAVRLYTAFPFVFEQVDQFIAERANFLPSSPTS